MQSNAEYTFDSKAKEYLTQKLLEKNIVALNHLIAKLEQPNPVLNDKISIETDDTALSNSQQIFQDQISKLDELGMIGLHSKESIDNFINLIKDKVLDICDKEYGTTTKLALQRKDIIDNRSIKEIITGKQPSNLTHIDISDSVAFGFGNLSPEKITAYKVVPASDDKISTASLQKTISIKTAFEKFESDIGSRDSWSNDTKQMISSVKNILLKFFGEDRCISSLTRDDLLKFQNTLPSIPTKMLQKSKYTGKSLNEIIRLAKNDNKLSQSTISKYMQRVIQFFNHCFESGYIEKTITTNLKTRAKSAAKPAKEILPYSIEEANQIFDIVTNMKNKNICNSSRVTSEEIYYITIIAAYSGMRIKEITQLTTNDIITKDGVLCFNINNNDGKTVKNTNSIRVVPIHDKLIEMGLLQYIERLKRKNLFKITNKDFSEIFRKQINRKLITTDESKVFYSFRHYFINYLVQREQRIEYVAQIVGHEKQYKITLGTYALALSPRILKPLVDMVKYE